MANFDIKEIIRLVETKIYGDDPEKQGNNKIDTEEEKSIFQGVLDDAAKNGKISQQSAAAIFGLYTGEDAAVPERKAVKERKEGYALESIQAMDVTIDDIANIDNLLAKLDEKFAGDIKYADYSKKTLTKAIVEVANMFSAKEFDSKDDIKKIKKEVKAEIKKNDADPLKDFKLDVLDVFTDKAYAVQEQKERKVVADRYQELRYPTEKDKKPLSREDALETIRDEFWDKGSYYRHIAAKAVRDIVMPDAVEQVQNAIRNQSGKENITSLRDVRGAVKAELGDDYDEYAKNVLMYGEDGSRTFKEQFVNLDPSVTKALAKSVAADNRIMNAKKNGLSEEDLEDAFGTHFWKLNWSSNYTAIEKLLNAKPPLIKEREDGKYDITPLSDKIALKVGGNNAMDYQKKDYIAYSEMENIIKDILSEGGLTTTNLRKEDVIKLVKYCGYDYNEDGFFKKLYQGTLGGVANAVTGVASAFAVDASATANLTKDVINYAYSADVPWSATIDVNNNIVLSFTTNTEFVNINGDDIVRQLFLQGFRPSPGHTSMITYTENGFTITATQSVPWDIEGIQHWEDEFGINLKDYGVDAEADLEMARKKALLITAGITLGLMLLNAACKESGGELPVAATQFDNSKTYDKYIKELDVEVQSGNMSPKVASALKALAHEYVITDENGKPKLDENGNTMWNPVGFKQMLNGRNFAGDGSFLNKYELAIGAGKSPKVADEPAAPAGDQPVHKVEVTKVVTEPTTVTGPDTPVVLSREYEVMPGDSWHEMVEHFYPGITKKLGYMGAIRAFQKALSENDDGVVDKQKYYKITHSNLNGRYTDKKGKVHEGTKLNLPPTLSGIPRNDKGEPKKVNYNQQPQPKKTDDGNGGKKAAPKKRTSINQAGRVINGTILGETTTTPGSTTYTARNAGKGEPNESTGKTKEEALEEYKRKAKLKETDKVDIVDKTDEQ